MSLVDKLQQIKAQKASIKAAIAARGVDMEGAELADYSSKIAAIHDTKQNKTVTVSPSSFLARFRFLGYGYGYQATVTGKTGTISVMNGYTTNTLGIYAGDTVELHIPHSYDWEEHPEYTKWKWYVNGVEDYSKIVFYGDETVVQMQSVQQENTIETQGDASSNIPTGMVHFGSVCNIYNAGYEKMVATHYGDNGAEFVQLNTPFKYLITGASYSWIVISPVALHMVRGTSWASWEQIGTEDNNYVFKITINNFDPAAVGADSIYIE